MQPNRETRGAVFHLARENPDKPDMSSPYTWRRIPPPFLLFIYVLAKTPSVLSGLLQNPMLSASSPPLPFWPRPEENFTIMVAAIGPRSNRRLTSDAPRLPVRAIPKIGR